MVVEMFGSLGIKSISSRKLNLGLKPHIRVEFLIS